MLQMAILIRVRCNNFFLSSNPSQFILTVSYYDYSTSSSQVQSFVFIHVHRVMHEMISLTCHLFYTCLGSSILTSLYPLVRSSHCASWSGLRASSYRCLRLVSSRPASSRRSTFPSLTPNRPARLRPLQRPTSLLPIRSCLSHTWQLAVVSHTHGGYESLKDQLEFCESFRHVPLLYWSYVRGWERENHEICVLH